MPTYTQADRPLEFKTPLGDDVLLLTGFRGHEAISQLFNFQVDLLAEAQSDIRFDRILGQKVTVVLRLANQEMRYFNGMVKRFSQGRRDDAHFVHFHAEVVPKAWLLTKKVRSRIFQHLPVPDILRKVLSGLDVAYELSATYYPRDYCVQYRESDFDFASRIMEEEGIYYYFKHTDGSHQMVVTDMSKQHPSVSGQNKIVYEELSGGVREEMRITAWEKAQELRSGEYTLWDHCFELPGNHLEATGKIIDSVTVGKVTHKLKVGGNDQLEIYDYPGGYAQRFDGVDRHGSSRPQDLQDIFRDRERTVRLRMEQEEALSLDIEGTSNCGHLVAGHAFTLQRHFDADGAYLLTHIEHDARQGDYRSDQGESFHYENRFRCIPVALPYRPQRVTPKPVIPGIQTATVVGPPGEELFCDQYGRVKVQFHWDREGKKDADSSCWLRVAQVWAGKRWGAFFWPRIGHEVVVAFEDGDPDQPIVVGSVYNAENMPPMHLPDANMYCGIKSSSLRGKINENFNGITFVDVHGNEHLSLHSERHMVLMTEYDVAAHNGRHHFQRTPGALLVSVGSLPGMGGSGGGPAQPSPDSSRRLSGGGSGGAVTTATGTVSGTPWAAPQPTSIAGLSSSVVYGSAFTSSWPISLQLANGSLLKVVVDPAGFEEAFPDSGAAMQDVVPIPLRLPQGASGNVQLTLGNSINVVVGRIYDVHIGPEKFPIHTDGKSGAGVISPTLATALGLIGILFQVAYALLGAGATPSSSSSSSSSKSSSSSSSSGSSSSTSSSSKSSSSSSSSGGVTTAQVSDDLRGLLVMAFQVTTQVLLACLVSSAITYVIPEIVQKQTHNNLHGVPLIDYKDELQREIDRLKDFQPTIGAQIIYPGLLVPVLMDSASEIGLSQASGLPS